MKKILIIEDESNISDFIKMELEYEGYEAEISEDGKEGLIKALREDYDLIVLDLMLPGISGLEVCRRLKKEKDIPVIMLSAKDSVMDKVAGLQIGADDYIAKPFAIEELIARIQVIFRRAEKVKSNIIKFKDLSIQLESRTVMKNEEKINYIFSNIYEINNDIDCKVNDRDLSLKEFNERSVIIKLISYAVGCMFGRYSLD